MYFRWGWVFLLVSGMLGTAGAGEPLIFGVYAADKPSAVVKQIRPWLNDIQDHLVESLDQPVKIKMQIASTYSKGVDDIVAGQVDFARLGPASYVEVKSRQPGIRLLAVESQQGKKRFSGMLVVRRDSAIKTVADLKGKRFAFGDRRSTMGRYLAQQYLLRAGIHADDLASYDYLGRHDRVGWAVAVGAYDAGALKEGSYQKLVEAGAQLRILATFVNVTKPWVGRADLDHVTFQGLRDSLLALGADRFLPGNDHDFDIIRQAIDENARFFSD